ncbi:MAG: nucleotidyltransferase family protein [Clostridia bacterium]|nr:nucleotidyltransferase family protein [Clostridia bacterium]
MGLNLSEINWYNAVLELVRKSIGTSNGEFEFNNLSEQDWQDIAKETFAQTMGLMCFDAACSVRSNIPKSIYDEWFKRTLRLTANGVKNAAGQEKLVKLLTENNIPYVILKGASSAHYYPNPDKRASGDVDFIVNPDDVEKTKKLMLETGYILERESNPVHYELDYENVRFELHKKISGLPEDRNAREIFAAELENIVSMGEMCDAGFVKPCDYHHGIVIFLHIMHHMLSNGIGARQLCDWACFVTKTHEKDFWREKMIPLLKKTGTFVFASAITEACVHYLNVPKPSWHDTVSDELRDSVINEIYSSGNFGRKNPSNNSYINLMVVKNSKKLTMFGKIAKMARSLHNSNKTVFPIIEKAPYLYPFIMIYRILRHIVFIIRGKRPSLLKVSQQADARNKIFMKYKLYETEK